MLFEIVVPIIATLLTLEYVNVINWPWWQLLVPFWVWLTIISTLFLAKRWLDAKVKALAAQASDRSA